MRILFITGLIVSTFLFAASVIAAPRTAKATQGGRLARVFVPDMLSADLPYLERITGPAWRTMDDEKVYKVDGCEVTATVDNGRVHALGLELGPKCTFDLNKFINGGFPSLHTMTFGQFETLTDGSGSGQFMASCLSLCGNAADPDVYEHWEGIRAVANLNVILEVWLGADGASEAAETWQSAMEAGEGTDWVEDRKFNCQGSKYDALAHKAFKNVKITAITVGYGIDMKTRLCKS